MANIVDFIPVIRPKPADTLGSRHFFYEFAIAPKKDKSEARLLTFFCPWPFAQPHAGTAAVFVDKFDASMLECFSYGSDCVSRN